MLASRIQVRGFEPKPSDFSGRKNSQHAFLRRGSKAVDPMSQICEEEEVVVVVVLYKD
jgi:hypothetical protein